MNMIIRISILGLLIAVALTGESVANSGTNQAVILNAIALDTSESAAKYLAECARDTKFNDSKIQTLVGMLDDRSVVKWDTGGDVRVRDVALQALVEMSGVSLDAIEHDRKYPVKAIVSWLDPKDGTVNRFRVTGLSDEQFTASRQAVAKWVNSERERAARQTGN